MEGKFLTFTFTDGLAIYVALCIVFTSVVGVWGICKLFINWFLKNHFHM